ncbi:6-bladed beta-propeller [Puteibacter caeruleilacunae]|nr:6-bladed beta-propeller [Puteibacter caeruleilacunae]
MKRLIVFLIGAMGLTSLCNAQQTSIPVIDKEKKYPEKEFLVDTEKKFVQLETRDDVLIDRDAHVYYVSDERILIANKIKGDVFIFDMNGKCLSNFNQKGGYGYKYLGHAMYDEKQKEIYILDAINSNILVFEEDGTLKRTLRKPKGLSLKEIYNFDENTLLGFHEYGYGELKVKQPYFFISKKSGELLSHVDYTMNKANPRIIQNGESVVVVVNNYSGSCKFGDQFVLSNLSSDTIYVLNKDKSLKPLLIQKPTVFNDPPVITSIGMLTDEFICLCTYPFNLKAARKRVNDGDGPNLQTGAKFFIYEFKTGEIYEQKNREYWAEKIDIHQNMYVEKMDCWLLKHRLEQGRLEGELKKIAEKIDINNNPVIIVGKIKK